LIIKQKTVLKERNVSQKELIIQLKENEKQLKENEKLKNKLTKTLQEEVEKQTSEIIALNQSAEEEKRKKLEIKFEKEMAELKISSLQSQMNPHFLFNSLNSIKLYIIKNDIENAVYYLNKFSKLIRAILSASRERVVSLEQEIETLELYASIENIRFKGEIDILFIVDKKINAATLKIPPLILQPFVENAIWHGFSSKKEGKRLKVAVTQPNDDYIQISIVDNGIGRKNAEILKNKKLHKKESVGLKITEERLLSFEKDYSNKHSIEFIDLYENEQSNGTKVLIKLPIR